MNSPLRKKRKQTVILDPVTGQPRVVESTEKSIRFINGSLDSDEIQTFTPLHCGCITAAGGQCYECKAIVCKEHLFRCTACGQGLCPEHAHSIRDESGARVFMCKRCRNKTKRNSRIRHVVRSLLSPLVGWEDER